MPESKSRLNGMKSESPYAHSQDFLNIEEAPAAKETPDVSEYDLSRDRPSGIPQNGYNNYNYGGVAHSGAGSFGTPSVPPYGGPRRRSTNYMDALNRRLSEKNKNTELRTSDLARRKSTSPGMDFQDTRHDIETKIMDDESDRYSGVAMGDSFEAKAGDTPPLFKDSYMHEKDGYKKNGKSLMADSGCPDYYRSSFSSRGNDNSGWDRRKSSFAYEDYKKDIYNKMNMFNRD